MPGRHSCQNYNVGQWRSRAEGESPAARGLTRSQQKKQKPQSPAAKEAAGKETVAAKTGLRGASFFLSLFPQTWSEISFPLSWNPPLKEEKRKGAQTRTAQQKRQRSRNRKRNQKIKNQMNSVKMEYRSRRSASTYIIYGERSAIQE